MNKVIISLTDHFSQADLFKQVITFGKKINKTALIFPLSPNKRLSARLVFPLGKYCSA